MSCNCAFFGTSKLYAVCRLEIEIILKHSTIKLFFFFPVNNSLCRSIGTIGQETMFHTDSFMARSRCLFSLPSYLSLWLILFLLSLCITDTVNYGHTYGIKYPPLYAPLETRVFVQLKRGPARCYGAQGTTSRALQPARLELC